MLRAREDRGLYSPNKQQADRYYKIIKKTTKYPLSIRNDLIRLEHDPSSIEEYRLRVPVKAVKGGLWIGLIKPYEPIPKDSKICECKLYKRDNRWYLDVIDRERVTGLYLDVIEKKEGRGRGRKFNRKFRISVFQVYRILDIQGLPWRVSK